MIRWLPRRISAQLTLLMLGAIVLANVLSTLFFVLSRDRLLTNNPAETTGRLAGFIEVLDAAPPEQRPPLIAAFGAARPEYQLRQTEAPAPPAGRTEQGHHLARALGPAFTLTSEQAPGEPPPPLRHHIRLRDGTGIEVLEPRPQRPPFFGPQLVSLLAVGLALAALLVWTGRKIVRPLSAITRAAERFRPEASPVPLRESGPYEIRALARAFNALQGRIGELLTEKTNALAAVSHDLRTPITRMRLRAEFLPDNAERARMIHDLDQMDQMTRAALDHLRAVATGTDREAVDLASLLHTLADRFQDAGQDVRVERAERLIARVRPLDLERALDNLIENAIKYATPPRLRLYAARGEAVIEIEDAGPGIAPERREELMQPYTRGDHARGMNETGGFGLGLAIAREATQRQGGTFELGEARPHGLLVRLRLPLAT